MKKIIARRKKQEVYESTVTIAVTKNINEVRRDHETGNITVLISDINKLGMAIEIARRMAIGLDFEQMFCDSLRICLILGLRMRIAKNMLSII